MAILAGEGGRLGSEGGSGLEKARKSWGEVLAGSQANLFNNFVAYAAEWEAVAARWADEDYALLQPASPCWIMPIMYATVVLKQAVAKKELEL